MAAILSAILVIVCQTKPVLDLEGVFDGSHPYMKFGRNPMKNDQVRVTTDRRTDKLKIIEVGGALKICKPLVVYKF